MKYEQFILSHTSFFSIALVVFDFVFVFRENLSDRIELKLRSIYTVIFFLGEKLHNKLISKVFIIFIQ